MNNKSFLWLTTLPLLAMSLSAFSLEKIFYINAESPRSVRQALPIIKQNAKQISVIGPQSLNIDEHGNVSGKVPKTLVSLARKNQIKILPLVVNSQLKSKEATHRFLHSDKAQKHAIQQLLHLVKKNHFAGLQVDFENMYDKDRNYYTRFYQKLAEAFHKNNLKISVAVIALSDFSLSKGMFDIKALTKASDFVSVMTYDQHYRGSEPGPVAGIPYDERNIQLALKYIPRDKLSFGIPSYGYHWSSHYGYRHARTISYQQVKTLKTQHGLQSNWDAKSEVPYLVYYHAGKENTIYYENERSFAAKLALAKKYQLPSISVWSLSTLDPKVWATLNLSKT